MQTANLAVLQALTGGADFGCRALEAGLRASRIGWQLACHRRLFSGTRRGCIGGLQLGYGYGRPEGVEHRVWHVVSDPESPRKLLNNLSTHKSIGQASHCAHSSAHQNLLKRLFSLRKSIEERIVPSGSRNDCVWTSSR